MVCSRRLLKKNRQMKTLASDDQDVYEEVLEIVSYLTYYSPSISLAMWQLYPIMCKALHDWAMDYFENILIPLDNYISRSTEVRCCFRTIQQCCRRMPSRSFLRLETGQADTSTNHSFSRTLLLLSLLPPPSIRAPPSIDFQSFQPSEVCANKARLVLQQPNTDTHAQLVFVSPTRRVMVPSWQAGAANAPV
jgi:hypothetical protein